MTITASRCIYCGIVRGSGFHDFVLPLGLRAPRALLRGGARPRKQRAEKRLQPRRKEGRSGGRHGHTARLARRRRFDRRHGTDGVQLRHDGVVVRARRRHRLPAPRPALRRAAAQVAHHDDSRLPRRQLRRRALRARHSLRGDGRLFARHVHLDMRAVPVMHRAAARRPPALRACRRRRRGALDMGLRRLRRYEKLRKTRRSQDCAALRHARRPAPARRSAGADSPR